MLSSLDYNSSMKVSNESIVIDNKNTVINYRIERRATRKKSIAISITPKDGVVVKAPVFAKTRRINQFVNKKASWILKSLEKNKVIQEETKKEYANGECFSLLGKDYRLLLKEAKIKRKVRPELINGQIVIKVPIFQIEEQRIEWIRDSLALFYKTQAMRIISKAVRRLSIHIGHSPNDIKVKKLKSTWGICRQNYISFNWRLIMAQMSIIEYVVAHEICHLKHKNHSKDFWSMLGSVQPDYKERRTKLKKISHLLDI